MERLKKYIIMTLGVAILAFGLYNIHSEVGISEGGTLGMTLLLSHHFSLSPAVSSIILNAVCYIIGWRALGKEFIINSAYCTALFSAFYALFEYIGPVLGFITASKIASSLIGALFVGVGVGLCVVYNGAPSGDDALAMSMSKLFRVNIAIPYLVSDVAVLLLSLSYIPFYDIIYSLLTVVLSGQVIRIVDKLFSTLKSGSNMTNQSTNNTGA